MERGLHSLQQSNHHQLLGSRVQLCKAPQRSRRQAASVPCRAIHIDRRAHLENAWKRDEKVADLLAKGLSGYPAGDVVPVRDLVHLESLLEGPSTRSAVVVVGFYSRSCGVCKEVFRKYNELATQAASQRAGVHFLSHDVHNEFDERSAVARMYGVRSVPSFLFFVDGALVKGLAMPDSRQMASAFSRKRMQGVMGYRLRELQDTIRQLLYRNAPSARK